MNARLRKLVFGKRNPPDRYFSIMLPPRVKTAAKRRRLKSSYAPGFGPKDAKEAKLLRQIAQLGRRERNTMAKKKKKSRKRRQPAGLARYWAKKRKQKNARRRKPVARKNARKKTWHKAMAKVGVAKSYQAWVKAMGSFPAKRRKKKNARRKTSRRLQDAQHVHLGITLSKKQKSKLARALSAITGKRVHVK